MEIIYTCGCMSDSVTVDGKNFNELELSLKKEVLEKMLNKLFEEANTEESGMYSAEALDLLINLIMYLGDYESLGTCEECGDSIDKYSFSI